MRANPKDIVALLHAGRTAKETAEGLGVSIRTVWTYDEEFFTRRLPRIGRPSGLPELNAKYQNWLTVYNTARPHHGLNFFTPQQMLPT